MKNADMEPVDGGEQPIVGGTVDSSRESRLAQLDGEARAARERVVALVVARGGHGSGFGRDGRCDEVRWRPIA
jgi:hypothetical protein